MALVGNILLGTGAAPAMSSIASAYAESAASSRIPWSALEYSGQTITAISGSAIGGHGGTDSATVSAIASAYAESAASGKLDNSASSMFQPSGQYQTAGDYAYNSSVSSKLDASASSQFAPSGNYADKSALSSYVPVSASGQFAPSGDYAYNSALTGKLDQSAFTAYTATAQGKIYTGVDPIVVDNENDQISLSATAVHLDSSMTAYTSGGSGFIGVNADFGAFVHTSDISGYIPTGESSKYQLTANMSGYIPTSESSKYYSTGNPSSFATTAQLESVISGKLDSSSQVVTSTAGSSYYVYHINGSSISAHEAEDARRAVSAYVSGSSIPMSTFYDGIVDLHSAKLDTTAQVVTALTTGSVSTNVKAISRINGMYISAEYVHSSQDSQCASMAYSAIVDPDNDPIVVVPMSAFAYNSSVSSKLDATAAYTPTFGYDGGKISSIDGSALAGGGGMAAYTSPSGTIAVDNVNGTLESWNSSLRVDEHITEASSIPGTASFNICSGNPRVKLWTGTAIEGDAVIFSAYNGNGSYYMTASGFGYMVGGGSSQLTTFDLPPNAGAVTASALIDSQYSAFGMSWSQDGWTPEPAEWLNLSGNVVVERPGKTASSTSVYENVLKDSMWQSLTAWAVTKGWTP